MLYSTNNEENKEYWIKAIHHEYKLVMIMKS